MEIRKVVLTGGPCAGKSTALEWLAEEFEKAGYTVLMVAESPTEVMNAGVLPDRLSNYEFEIAIVKLQLEKEALYDRAAQALQADRVLILYDRGILDPMTYTTPEEFGRICQELNLDPEACLQRYDGVFHLVTAAKGASEYYSLNTNTVRREADLEAAIKADDALIEVWQHHPHYRIIDNSTGFEAKLLRLAAGIRQLLGLETSQLQSCPVEITDWQQLQQMPGLMEQEVLVTVLESSEAEERQIMQVKNDGAEPVFYLQVQKKDRVPADYQQRISKNEYIQLLMQADTAVRQRLIHRYGFFWQDAYMQIIQDQDETWLETTPASLQACQLPIWLKLKKAA